jgi:tRNA-splicing ligase RtcB
METRINGNDLIALGYEQGPTLGIALKINRKRNGFTREEMLHHYKNVLAAPETYLDHKVFGKLAASIIEEANAPKIETIALQESPKTYTVYGAEHIEEGAKLQMNTAMKLPVTVAGALMPDAHQGYGLPIGGVLATKDAIIPYGVGVDIGCRMALTVFDIPEQHFYAHEDKYKRELIAATKFGAGAGFHGQYKADHEVLERNELNSCTIKLTRNLDLPAVETILWNGVLLNLKSVMSC